jgi:hypothetical protein
MGFNATPKDSEERTKQKRRARRWLCPRRICRRLTRRGVFRLLFVEFEIYTVL